MSSDQNKSYCILFEMIAVWSPRVELPGEMVEAFANEGLETSCAGS